MSNDLSIYDILKNIDNLITKNNKKYLYELNNLVEKNEVALKYFFDKLIETPSFISWLEPLAERGYFNPDQNPYPQEDKNNPGYYWVPYWSAITYLQMVAIENEKKTSPINYRNTNKDSKFYNRL